MKHRPLSVRAMTSVDRALRRAFPDDAGQRCMYAAYALAALLRDAGYQAIVVGGDFLAFVPNRDGLEAAFHGFGGGVDAGTASHYWVESENRLLDTGPLLLPQTAAKPIETPPAVYWPLEADLPRYLRYNPRMRMAPDAVFSTIREQCEKAENLIDDCRRRMRTAKGTGPTKLALLDGPNYTRLNARSDAWASAAWRYENSPQFGDPPF